MKPNKKVDEPIHPGFLPTAPFVAWLDGLAKTEEFIAKRKEAQSEAKDDL